VAIDGEVLLRRVDWAPPERGVVHILGPPGSGKTLLGAILGRYTLPETTRFWGELTYGGVDWRVRPPAAVIGPTLPGATTELPEPTVRANLLRHMPTEEFLSVVSEGDGDTGGADRSVDQMLARYGVDTLSPADRVDELDGAQRQALELLCALARRTNVIYLDELFDGGSGPTDDYLRILDRAATRHLVVLTEAPESVRARLGGRVVRLRDGVVDDGSALAPRPDPEAPPAPPTWLRWIVHGQLCGMPRPGRPAALDETLEALVEQGITHVLGLEEESMERRALEEAGLEVWHLPIEDMCAPDPDEARAVCARIEEALADGAVFALHCREGIGRTGTLLASLLVMRGYLYSEALTLLRSIYPHYIQSDPQHDFLRALETPP
jgi:atypical dual specificity phosphatase